MRVDSAIIVQDIDALQVVALASGKVVRVMGWCDFDCSSTKAHVHQLSVLNDGHLAPVQGMYHELAVQVLVSAPHSSVSCKASLSPSQVQGIP